MRFLLLASVISLLLANSAAYAAIPTANAGPDQAGVAKGATVVLDGSGSFDTDGDPLTYAWTLTTRPAGSGATLTAPTTVSPTFIADVAGTYIATLVVSDATDPSAPDTVQITVVNAPPVADAGPDQGGVAKGATVILNGSGSSDPDAGDTLTYSWTLTTRPAGSTATLTAPTTVNPSFVADVAGAYEARLVVSDGTTASAPDTVQITVVNAPPVADAGPDQGGVAKGATVVLDGSGSSDPDAGDTLSYSWTLTTRPAGSTAALTAPTTVSPTFVPDVAGTYEARLVVSDGTTASAPDTVQISVVNAPPVANAGPDQVGVAKGATVVLDGSGSSDPDVGDTLTYSWTLTTRPLGSSAALNNPNLVGPSFVADAVGTYVATLVVSDGTTVSAQDSVTITVANNPPTVTITSPLTGSSFGFGTSINFVGTATDAEDGVLTPAIAWSSDGDGPLGTGGSINVTTLTVGAHVITASVTDVDDGEGAASINITITNTPPTATDVAITGTPQVGQTLTGTYTYNDAEGDLEGTSTFRWIRDGNPISQETGITYVVAPADKNKSLRFEVTPVAATGETQGSAVQSAELLISNTAPSITGQNVVEIPEDSSREIVLADLTIADVDDNNCATTTDCTVVVQNGANYTRSGVNGNTITPILDFNGPLTVSVIVNDGTVDSAVFPMVVTVLPVNDAPVIAGLVAPLSTLEDTPLTILVEHLVIVDPDNVFPGDFTLALQDGLNYTRVDNTITPAENYSGELTIAATVSDLEPLSSNPPFSIIVTVTSVNDIPTVDLPIGPRTVIENTPFSFDVSGNFSDADGDPLSFSAIGLPGNLSIDPVTGVISGTPRFEDARDNDPYVVTVTVQDPLTEFASDVFDLTVSALDRANLALGIDVNSNTAMPTEDLRWTFSATNPVGPQPGQNVELVGSFVGVGLTVTAEVGANCTIQPEVNTVTDFTCVLGALPVGATLSTVLTTTTTQASEVIAFATAAGADNLPIDPNDEDNSAFEAAGVADAFSVGAVQQLGSLSVRSVTTGDVNADGRVDIVVGTTAGQPVQVFLSDVPRESCQCPRDFVAAGIPIVDTAANEGVALADFDNNGSLDLVVANGGGLMDNVYLNDGTGNFTTVPPTPLGTSFAQDVAVGDFNNDGNRDIAVADVGANAVYLGNGAGGFSLEGALGSANSVDVAVARFNGDNLDDLVFANVGGPSQVWLRNAGGGFTAGSSLNIGDAVSVAAAELNGAGGPDLVFGRTPTDVGDLPANPILLNNGTGGFGAPVQFLGFSPTNDVQIGEVNGDGLPDIVFINASGVHQIWTADAGSYVLHREQIIDGDARAGVLADLGFTDDGNPGGADLAMGGANLAGVGVYLNDGAGNLGRGDAVPPVLTLLGQASVSIDSGSVYTDAGATALDNIDGDLTASISVTGSVNSAVVGSYTLTYNVSDFAGNPATAIVRNVSVVPAVGTGGGGGGAVSLDALLILLALLLFVEVLRRRQDLGAMMKIRTSKDKRDD